MTSAQAKEHLRTLPAIIVSGLNEDQANEIGQMIKQQTGSGVKVEKSTNRSTPTPSGPTDPRVITRPGARERFDVTLVRIAPRSKLKVVKVLRDELGLTLAQANLLASNPPSVIARNISKTKKDTLIRKLISAGGTATAKKTR